MSSTYLFIYSDWMSDLISTTSRSSDDTVESFIQTEYITIGNPVIELIHGYIKCIKFVPPGGDDGPTDISRNCPDSNDSTDCWQVIGGNGKIRKLHKQSILMSYRDPSPPIDTVSSDELDLGVDILCLSNIPTYITLIELNSFIQPASNYITHIQLVNTGSSVSTTSNTYAVLLKFMQSNHTAQFIREYNYKPFNSIEPQCCTISYVFQVILQTNNANHVAQPFIQSNNTTCSSPSPSYELGSCAVCLDPLTNGTVVGILCCHEFHIDCIVQWSESSTCPVCRYVNHPIESSTCNTCQTTNELWLCVVCGDIGCGRYSNGHAIQHYQLTGHNYAQELSTQRVWDYINDCYVHRLIQSKSDNKLIEYTNDNDNNNKHSDTLSIDQTTVQHHNKLENLLNEYNYMLSTELEQQRTYFTTHLNALHQQHNQLIDVYTANISNAQYSIQQLQQRYNELQQHYTQSNIVNSQLDIKLSDVQKHSVQLQQLNQKLMQQQQVHTNTNNHAQHKQATIVQSVLNDKDQQINSLQQQINDAQTYLSTQKQISKNTFRHDITQGQLFVADHAELIDTTDTNRLSTAKHRLQAKLAQKQTK